MPLRLKPRMLEQRSIRAFVMAVTAATRCVALITLAAGIKGYGANCIRGWFAVLFDLVANKARLIVASVPLGTQGNDVALGIKEAQIDMSPLNTG